jgi:hypothetical protein
LASAFETVFTVVAESPVDVDLSPDPHPVSVTESNSRDEIAMSDNFLYCMILV